MSEDKVKLIKTAQLAGLGDSTTRRKRKTRLAVEQACATVYRSKRPSVDNVLREGAGRFCRSSVDRRERHGWVVELWQRTWDEQHPDEAARRRVVRQPLVKAGVAQEAPADEPVTDIHEAVAAAVGTSDDPGFAATKGAELERLLKAEIRLKAQLAAALDHVEERDRRHASDREEIAQLRRDLARARAAPRPRLPKRFEDSADDATRH